MKRFFFIFISLLLVFLLVISYFAYTRGAKYYFEAKSIIEKTPEDKKAQALSIFEPQDEYLYTGIYMGSLDSIISGVWVWGKSGPKFFKSDEYTVYSLYKMCTSDLSQNLESGEPINPMRGIYTDISEWKDNLNVGNFIIIRKASEYDISFERAREAIVYDWWVFDVGVNTIETLCEL